MHHIRFSLPTALGLLAARLPTFAAAASQCPSINGTFAIDLLQLYPENADWDPVNCKLYLSAMYNASVVVYDPYTRTSNTITLPNITHVDPYHVAGIDYNAATRSMFFTAVSGMPFRSRGTDLSGRNQIVRYSLDTNDLVYMADLAGFSAQVKQATGVTIGGFQDTAEDGEGNCYTVPTYGVQSVARISPKGDDVAAWFVSNVTGASVTDMLYGGLAWHPPSGKLIVADMKQGSFATFDTKASGSPVTSNIVKLSGMPTAYTSAGGVACDGLTIPSRYPDMDVILCSEDGLNAITVFVSTDDWVTARYVGQVDNDDALASGSAMPVATVQVGGGQIFITEEWMTDGPSYDTAGTTRASFPQIDITAKLDAILSPAGVKIAVAA